jgi:hypothetical protein
VRLRTRGGGGIGIDGRGVRRERCEQTGGEAFRRRRGEVQALSEGGVTSMCGIPTVAPVTRFESGLVFPSSSSTRSAK